MYIISALKVEVLKYEPNTIINNCLHNKEDMMKLRPLADRVVVKPVEDEDKTPGGIILPDTAKEKPMKGEIISVGPGGLNDKGERIKPDVKKGDTVIYGKYSGTEFKMDNQEYLILRESDILAVIEK
jgi:chaperonin GroES